MQRLSMQTSCPPYPVPAGNDKGASITRAPFVFPAMSYYWSMTTPPDVPIMLCLRGRDRFRVYGPMARPRALTTETENAAVLVPLKGGVKT